MKETLHTNHQQSACMSFLCRSTVYYVTLTVSLYFVGGVQFSTGEYGTGYLHTGTNASLLWSWFLLFFSLVSNLLLWVTEPEHWVDWQDVVSPAQSASVMPLSPLPDAVREVQKYSGPEPMHDAVVNPNLYDNVHMKLFRAQRNLYISGFSLFLWLLVLFPSTFIQNNSLGPQSKTNTTVHFTFWFPVFFFFWFSSLPVLHHSIMRRIVTLLNQVAVTVESSAGLQAQMDNAVKAAKQHQNDNLRLKQVRLNQSLMTELKLIIIDLNLQ